MRVAALYDIHGNLPALEAVLDEVRRAGVDYVVIGGDVLPGPMPRETLRRLLDLDLAVGFIQGNGELAALALVEAAEDGAVSYWGTASGAPPPEPVREANRWCARQLGVGDVATIAKWPKTLMLPVDGLGPVLFCHATPRSETEIFTRLTPEDRLRPVFEGQPPVVICGHTHMPFDRTIGTTRVVNAGSVGMPFGEPGASWALLGPGVELRRTPYDLEAAAERIRATSYPQAEEFASSCVLHPPSEATMLEAFGRYSITS